MSLLKELHKRAIAEDKQVNVEYMSATGRFTRGVINRFWNGGGLQIAIETGETIDVMGINVTNRAGPACVKEWCLNGHYRSAYSCLASAEDAAVLELDGTEEMCRLFGDMKDKVDDVRFLRVLKWPNKDAELISGFVCVNASYVDQPFCGWLVYRDGNHEFMHGINPANIEMVVL